MWGTSIGPIPSRARRRSPRSLFTPSPCHWSRGPWPVNRFFSPVVRIQTEHGYYLVTAGPYAFVRHPGYLGMCIAFPASAVALGSWLALIPAGACAFAALQRAALEDRYLLENLPGYRDYSEAVRYRLLPGLW